VGAICQVRRNRDGKPSPQAPGWRRGPGVPPTSGTTPACMSAACSWASGEAVVLRPAGPRPALLDLLVPLVPRALCSPYEGEGDRYGRSPLMGMAPAVHHKFLGWPLTCGEHAGRVLPPPQACRASWPFLGRKDAWQACTMRHSQLHEVTPRYLRSPVNASPSAIPAARSGQLGPGRPAR
jgi:hypothetical protein